MKKFLYMLTLLLMCTFVSHAQDSQLVTSSYRVADSTKYKIKILEEGDKFSFEGLCYIYEYDLNKILPYVLIMSEIHKVEMYDPLIYEGLFSYIKKNEDMEIEKKKLQ